MTTKHWMTHEIVCDGKCALEEMEARIRREAFKEAAEAVQKMYPNEADEDPYSEGQSSYVNAITTAHQTILALAERKDCLRKSSPCTAAVPPERRCANCKEGEL